MCFGVDCGSSRGYCELSHAVRATWCNIVWSRRGCCNVMWPCRGWCVVPGKSSTCDMGDDAMHDVFANLW